MQQKERQREPDPLVGQFVIVRDPDGQPIKAGRIRSRTLDGNYQVTIMTRPKRGQVVTEAQMAAERWEFYIDEGNWRCAFAAAANKQ
jgi:hypothetical protein